MNADPSVPEEEDCLYIQDLRSLLSSATSASTWPSSKSLGSDVMERRFSRFLLNLSLNLISTSKAKS